MTEEYIHPSQRINNLVEVINEDPEYQRAAQTLYERLKGRYEKDSVPWRRKWGAPTPVWYEGALFTQRLLTPKTTVDGLLSIERGSELPIQLLPRETYMGNDIEDALIIQGLSLWGGFLEITLIGHAAALRGRPIVILSNQLFINSVDLVLQRQEAIRRTRDWQPHINNLQAIEDAIRAVDSWIMLEGSSK